MAVQITLHASQCTHTVRKLQCPHLMSGQAANVQNTLRIATAYTALD